MINWVEPSVPVHPRSDDDRPDGCWMFCDTLLVFDQVRRQVTAVAYADHSQNGDPATARAAAESRLDALETQLQQPLPAGLTPLAWKEQDAQALKVVSNTTQSALKTLSAKPATTSALVMFSSWCCRSDWKRRSAMTPSICTAACEW